MTGLENLERLKNLIDEENYPYFDDGYLLEKLDTDITIEKLARDLCLIKAGIEEIKLGDITIPSPKNHFLMLASGYRKNHTGVVIRADER